MMPSEKAGRSAKFHEVLQRGSSEGNGQNQNIMHWFSGGPDLSVYTRISLHSIADKTASNSLKLAMMSYPEALSSWHCLHSGWPNDGGISGAGYRYKRWKIAILNADSPIVKKFMAEE
jgi:hypothetical protein